MLVWIVMILIQARRLLVAVITLLSLSSFGLEGDVNLYFYRANLEAIIVQVKEYIKEQGAKEWKVGERLIVDVFAAPEGEPADPCRIMNTMLLDKGSFLYLDQVRVVCGEEFVTIGVTKKVAEVNEAKTRPVNSKRRPRKGKKSGRSKASARVPVALVAPEPVAQDAPGVSIRGHNYNHILSKSGGRATISAEDGRTVFFSRDFLMTKSDPTQSIRKGHLLFMKMTFVLPESLRLAPIANKIDEILSSNDESLDLEHSKVIHEEPSFSVLEVAQSWQDLSAVQKKCYNVPQRPTVAQPQDVLRPDRVLSIPHPAPCKRNRRGKSQ